MTKKRAGTALVIDGRLPMQVFFAACLQLRYEKILQTGDPADARAILRRHEPLSLVLVTVDSIDAGAFLAAMAQNDCVPTPLVFARHEKPFLPQDAFALGRLGLKRLFTGDVGADELLKEIDAAENAPLPDLLPMVAPFVGRMGLFELERAVRRAVVQQAVAQSGENRSVAARMLKVPRPVIQRALRGESPGRQSA